MADKDTNKSRLSNMQVQQEGMDMSPADGGEGYVGGNTNASTFGTEYVTGKKGYTTTRPIWSEQTDSQMGSAAPDQGAAGSDSTDEKASYKHIQTDEGLPQTYRTSEGAGDAGVSGSDEPDQNGENPNADRQDTQSVPGSDAGDHSMSDMPQTEFTNNHGGGAPLFKHRG